MPGQLYDLRRSGAFLATTTAHPQAHRYADGDAFPIHHPNSLDQPDVAANVHSYWDAVCYRYRNASTDLHTLTHPGDTRPHLHIHSHTHAAASSDVDSNTNVDRKPDVDTVSDGTFYPHNHPHVNAVANTIV